MEVLATLEVRLLVGQIDQSINQSIKVNQYVDCRK